MNKEVVEPWEGRTELTINLVIYRQIFIIKNVYTFFSGGKKIFFRNEHYYCCQSDVVINSIKLLESDEGKIPKNVFFLLDNCVSIFKSIAIIVTSIIICSFYQCRVDYPCGPANIL